MYDYALLILLFLFHSIAFLFLLCYFFSKSFVQYLFFLKSFQAEMLLPSFLFLVVQF